MGSDDGIDIMGDPKFGIYLMYALARKALEVAGGSITISNEDIAGTAEGGWASMKSEQLEEGRLRVYLEEPEEGGEDDDDTTDD